jgi:hypothetical protein
MSAVVVYADGHVVEAGGAVAVHQRPQQGQLAVDGILRPDRQVHRQVVRDACHLVGVGEAPGTGEHLFDRRGVDAESAQRISDIRVDDRLVAGEPIEIGARRLERGIEGGQVQIGGQVQGRFEKVESRGSSEGDRVDVAAVIQQKLLRRKRTHAVGDNHDGQSRVV